MKHFLKDDDIDFASQCALLELAKWFKANRPTGRPLAGPKSVAVVFEKESTRTRMSFQVGIAELGGNPVVVDAQSSHLSRGETIEDTARVLSGYVDAIVIRTFGDERITALAGAAGVPVVNALTDGFHPCQLLADLLTVSEEFGAIAGRTISYVGDAANNMAHSNLLAGALAGAHVRVAGPAGLQPDPSIVERAGVLAAAHGGSVTVTTDAAEAVAGADVVATDTWVSMGHADREQRLGMLAPYQVNSRLLDLAAKHAIVLHCLPAHRGEEITDEVLDGGRSRVFQQAHNRLHVQKALLTYLVTGSLDAPRSSSEVAA